MKISLHHKAIVFMAVILISLYAVSCRKSIYTTNIERTWVVSNYYKNGVDSTAIFNERFKNYSIVFNNNNGFIELYSANGKTPMVVKGMWQLIDNSKTLQLTDSVRIRSYTIERLKIKSMILLVRSLNQSFIYSPQ
jgi:hypothetical protein